MVLILERSPNSAEYWSAYGRLYSFVTPPRPIPVAKKGRASMPADLRAAVEASPPCNYAGAKFAGARPAPTELPMPPVHWVERDVAIKSCQELTNDLKVLLNVKVQS